MSLHLKPKIPRLPRKQVDSDDELERSLIQHEARIGGQLFGSVPEGYRREFFCLDGRTWVWHEEWLDEKGQRQAVTTRYVVHPSGVLKTQNGQAYQHLSHDEARNLYFAVELYKKRVHESYQQLIQAA